jgi:hypothetical protein
VYRKGRIFYERWQEVESDSSATSSNRRRKLVKQPPLQNIIREKEEGNSLRLVPGVHMKSGKFS